MSALALLTSRRAAPGDRLEFLRIVAALVACGTPLRLAELPDAAGALADDDLPDEAERLLEQLEALGTRPEVLEGSSLGRALAGATTVLRLGDPARCSDPDVLEIGGAPPTPNALAEAGQVVRAARAAASP